MLKTVNIFNKRINYEIIETFNAGIVLAGTEIKSIRLGKQISESFVNSATANFCNKYIYRRIYFENSTTKRRSGNYF
jgi:tmRNA-binding protein